MEIKYRWSENDLKTYAKFVAIQAYKQRGKALKVLRWAVVIFFGAFVLLFMIVKEWLLAVVFGAYVLCMGVFQKPILIKYWSWYNFRRQKKAEYDLFCDQSMQINDENIISSALSATTTIGYDLISKLEELDNVYFLILKQQQYIMIPKSAFKTNAEEQEFLGLIKSNTQIKK